MATFVVGYYLLIVLFPHSQLGCELKAPLYTQLYLAHSIRLGIKVIFFQQVKKNNQNGFWRVVRI